ncbi:unnamed protein product [Callosobruchus maculatus]|uniref:Uncharacterized protein n=1 Tax=Callosobruchus maculatus TaxID=64391 RepID=A0A653DFN7_CALMS|nr:unnamed protein product [Callosobruchus maculatus]
MSQLKFRALRSVRVTFWGEKSALASDIWPDNNLRRGRHELGCSHIIIRLPRDRTDKRATLKLFISPFGWQDGCTGAF